MELLMFGWDFPPYHKGGLGVATYHLAHALARQGVSVTFVLPKKLPVSVNEFNLLFAQGNAPIVVREVDSLLTPYLSIQEYKTRYGIMAALQKYGSSLMEEVKRYADVVREIIHDNNYDIIHAHDWLTIGAGINAKLELKRPLIKHVHATEVERSGGQGVNEIVYQLEKEGMIASDAVVTVSNRTRDIVLNHYQIPESRTHVIHNGIDVKDHHEDSVPFDKAIMNLKAQGKKIILYMGRFTIAKAPDIFLRAFQKLLEYNKDVVLIMAGTGEMEHQLIQYVADNKLSNSVLFPGWISDKDQVNSMYKSADLFVMPSIMEPFGLVPLEALINNTPVLISKQSGVSEVLSHALKVDFWDSDEMVNKMAAILSHQSLHHDLTANGKRQVHETTWDKAASKCIDLYKKLIFEKNTHVNYVL